jgi:hypothetical protein
LKPVAKARMRVDETAIGERRLQLAAQLAHVHIDGAVAGTQIAVPDGSVEIFARDDRAEAPRQRDEKFELADREGQGSPGGEHQPLIEANLELAGIEDVRWRVCAFWKGGHDAKRRMPTSLRRCKLVI